MLITIDKTTMNTTNIILTAARDQKFRVIFGRIYHKNSIGPDIKSGPVPLAMCLAERCVVPCGNPHIREACHEGDKWLELCGTV